MMSPYPYDPIVYNGQHHTKQWDLCMGLMLFQVSVPNVSILGHVITGFFYSVVQSG